jgi:ribosomal protein L30/L7E
MALIEIQLVQGAANNKQRKALTALGFKRIGANKWVPDTPEIRAKIKRVSTPSKGGRWHASTVRDAIQRVEVKT